MKINEFKPGEKFGLWTVVRTTNKRDKGGNMLVECQCDCGNTHLVRSFALKDGSSKGCRSCANKGFTHGLRGVKNG